MNSTNAIALVASKLGVRIPHVEAGLRSGDRSMPEEITRVLTDRISDFFFTPSREGDANLLREGIGPGGVFLVGNMMIDTLVRLLPKAQRPPLPEIREPFVLVTLHRPSNVDEPGMLKAFWESLIELSQQVQVVFPIHPRTRKRLEGLGGREPGRNLVLSEPLGYLELLWLQRHAVGVVTDSGGIQEETTFLRVPCLTLRENTERPVTVEEGSNLLIGRDVQRLQREVEAILAGKGKVESVPPLWDGHAGHRIAEILVREVGP